MSARKRSLLVLTGVGLILLGVIGLSSINLGTKIGIKYYHLEVVNSPEALQLGLSDREKIANNSGMLFSFSEEGKQCMWMKDMKFNLDMIWVNMHGYVIAIEQNVEPKSYPKNYCNEPAKYVIELNAGQVSESKITIGQKINFN